ncbi:hypothetical protein ANCCEY_09850 [Ancylostoma ceylanicum]|uniref:SCP domain-containing protein n=1 Tax=Ancylostoma ceylanicum TaxID=53326 RepID=A0A0D6LIM0_9BILA|nr:hypothetical protein ANCCEY_09850 [Ancylostoma ceylanicum]
MWLSLQEKIVQLLIIVTVSEATCRGTFLMKFTSKDEQLAGIKLLLFPAFGCRNTLISDEWRQRVLDHHNNIRRKNWDCDMENNAFLSTCDQTVQIPQAYASNSATFQITGKKCDINQNTMAVLKGWSDQAVAVDLSGGAVYNVQNQKEFGIMVFGETTGFACSYSQCGNDGKLLCLYNKQFVVVNFVLKNCMP